MSPKAATFHSWLGTLFGHSELQVRRLLDDEAALHFLMAWSLFESKCFGGFVRAAKIECYARLTSKSIAAATLPDAAEHFHARYQDSKLFENLMHEQRNERLSSLLKAHFANLTTEDRLFFLVFVIYRYRNNIFHGNKGVMSWLHYREQIQYCIAAMQFMVSHAEQIKPTMKAWVA